MWVIERLAGCIPYLKLIPKGHVHYASAQFLQVMIKTTTLNPYIKDIVPPNEKNLKERLNYSQEEQKRLDEIPEGHKYYLYAQKHKLRNIFLQATTLRQLKRYEEANIFYEQIPEDSPLYESALYWKTVFGIRKTVLEQSNSHLIKFKKLLNDLDSLRTLKESFHKDSFHKEITLVVKKIRLEVESYEIMISTFAQLSLGDDFYEVFEKNIHHIIDEASKIIDQINSIVNRSNEHTNARAVYVHETRLLLEKNRLKDALKYLNKIPPEYNSADIESGKELIAEKLDSLEGNAAAPSPAVKNNAPGKSGP